MPRLQSKLFRWPLCTKVWCVFRFRDEQRDYHIFEISVRVTRTKLNVNSAGNDLDRLMILSIFAVMPARDCAVVTYRRNVSQRRNGKRKAGVLV